MIVGAGISIEFNHYSSLILIEANYFEQNLADWSTAINAVHLSGTLVMKNNKFVNNKAITQNRVLIGSGAAVQISGSTFTIVKSSCNIYIYNEVEYTGKFYF